MNIAISTRTTILIKNNKKKKNVLLINKVQANKHTHTVMYQYYFEFVRLNSLLALHLLSWTKAHKQINKYISVFIEYD